MREVKELKVQLKVEFESGMKYARVFLKTDSHVTFVDFMYAQTEDGSCKFDYDKSVCLNANERADLEEWFIANYMKVR